MTLNDPVYVEAAQALARRMAAGGDDRAETGPARLPPLPRPGRRATREVDRLVQLYEAARDRVRQGPEARPAKLATEPLGPLPTGADVAELAAWTVVGNVLLNLDEMLMKR